MPASAADIPVELYDLILDFLQLDTAWNQWFDQYKRNAVPATKHQLGSCALVCRAWTPLCQPKMFSTVTLRSREDVMDLFSLVSSPYSRISQYILNFAALWTYSSSRGSPWVHLLCLKVQKSNTPLSKFTPFPKWLGHHLELQGPISPQQLKGGIHPSLPRYHPSFSCNICYLTLSDIKFRGLKDVVWLARDLPSLGVLRCQRLSWDRYPSEEQDLNSIIPMRPVGSKAIKSCSMTDCAEPWSVIPLAFALEGRRKEKVHKDEFNIMAQFMRTVVMSIDEDMLKGCNIHLLRFNKNYTLNVRSSAMTEELAPEIVFWFTKPLPMQDRFIEMVTIDFAPQGELCTVAHTIKWDWERIDEHLSRLNTFRCLVFGFSSIEDLALFVKEAEPRAQRLQAAGRLKYAVSNTSREGWGELKWSECTARTTQGDLRGAKCCEYLEELFM